MGQTGFFSGHEKSLRSYLREKKSDKVQEAKQRDEADLLRWVLGKVDAGLDVGLETLDAFVDELLLVIIRASQDIVCLFGTVGLDQNQYEETK